jgi:predicted transcriptional regulator
MYFGGFGMKTAPAMGKRDYAISTTLTGDRGQAFLEILDPGQRRLLEELVQKQRPALQEIVRVRRTIATELRRFLRGEVADQTRVIALSRRYGELDGHLSYLYATTFASLARRLSPTQTQALRSLRPVEPSEPKGPFLYSTPVSLARPGDTDRFFARGR